MKSRKEKAKIAQWKLTEATSPQSRSPRHYPPVAKAPERQDWSLRKNEHYIRLSRAEPRTESKQKRRGEQNPIINQSINRRRERDGIARIIKANDSNAGRNGWGKGPNSIQRPMRPFADPTQQVQAIWVLSSMEVWERAPCLWEVWVWACHGENASDAEDPWSWGQTQTITQARNHPSHPQDCKCLASVSFSVLVSGFFIKLESWLLFVGFGLWVLSAFLITLGGFV